MKRVLSILISLVLVLSGLMIFLSASEKAPSDGTFIFDKEDKVSFLDSQHNIDMTYDSGFDALKLVVNSSESDPDPYVLLKLDSFGLNSNDYSYMAVTYMCPNTNSSKARRFEIFVDAGQINSPQAGYSTVFSVSKTGTYVTQIIELDSLSWWTGQIHSFRLDFFTSASYGDTMYIDSIILCNNLSEAVLNKTERIGAKNGMNIYNSSYYAASYDVSKYTSPFWKGNIVYNEAVYPIKSKDGKTSYKLMYTPDEIVSVCDAQFSNIYIEGKDYTIEGDTITFLTTGTIDIKEYTYLHPTASMIPSGYSGWSPYYKRHAAGDGMYEYHTAEIARQYINVTYTHSDTWTGPVPEQSSSNLPRTADAITNKGTLNIVYYGDSICGGARASSYQNLYPYAEWWNQQITSKLRQDYGVTVNEQISSVGGSDAVTMSDPSKVESFVNQYSPDLVFIEFGVNDAQNYFVGGDSASNLKNAYKNAVISIIEQIRAKKPTCEFVLIAPYYSNIYDFKDTYFEVCRDALVEISTVTSGTAVADVTTIHEYLLSFKNYADFTGDNLCHPNDYMSRIYSQICLETIVPSGVAPYNYTIDAPEIQFETGDINQDGKITAIDANMLIKALTGQFEIENTSIGDMNEDGKISASDINILSKKILGLE